MVWRFTADLEKGRFLMLNSGFSSLGFNLQWRKGISQILIELDSAIAVQLVTIVNDVSCHPLATIIGRCSLLITASLFVILNTSTGRRILL